MREWWHSEAQETARYLGSDIFGGLSEEEAARRLKEYGPNQLKEAKGRSPFGIFLEQFSDFIIWVLIGAALVSGFLKEWIDAIAIVVIVILNAVLGFVQEYRAEKSLAALKKLSSPNAKVIRDGRYTTISHHQIVPGDLIEIESGDRIAADGRLVYLTPNFTTQEASITGESNPVTKTVCALKGDISLADRKNMVYMGTSVSSGKAKALVAETAMRTELGKIAGMIQQVSKETTPLQKKLEQFGKWIVYLCFVLVGVVFLLGIIRGGDFFDEFLTAVSLAVAAIPEGLPAVVTIALALGVQRMAKRHSLIRKLPAVETLGSTTVICSDKTGTLTKNEMTVQVVFAGGKLFKITGTGYEPKGNFLLDGNAVDPSAYPDLNKTLLAGTLCNGAQLVREERSHGVMGDPTEGAILVCAAKMGLRKDELEKNFPFVEEISFDPTRKKMTVLRRDKDRTVAFVKGAAEAILADCVNIEESGIERKLNEAERQKILAINNELASEAMRVLAVAYRVLDDSVKKYDADNVERNLVFLGLVGMIDPPREEVKKAIRECEAAGIRTVMITGDHKNTAVAIARQLGLFKEGSIAISGEELDKLNDEKFDNEVDKIAVYSRVSPEHKLRIVSVWRQRNEVVAMTGDGVNDAPAVKEADIGVAMGITGTDVTKEVSDMVITDDNFASIVAAVEEGRGIYNNIKKFIHYLLSCNAGEVLVMFISSLAALPAPLLPIHILWVNLITDGLPALALGVDPVEPNIMKRLPRPRNEAVVTRQRILLILTQGVFIAACSLFVFVFILLIEKGGLGQARTAAFIVLACSQLFHSFNCRSMTESIFKIGFFTNTKLLYAAVTSFILLIPIVHLPVFQKIFKTEGLTVFEWLLALVISSLPLWGMETIKLINKKSRGKIS